MPVALTYPGVYIEEIPSGVHTITGVSTSVTAFVGYTSRGAIDDPVHIFSFADFERAFGGLAVDSPLSYSVKYFFQNGGNEAYVVRVAHGAKAAAVTLKNSTTAGIDVLDITAASAGTWGNNLQIDVDYASANPKSLFNLKVTSFIEKNGRMEPGPTETFRNLSMNQFDPGFVVDTVNNGSQLVTAALNPAVIAPLAAAGSGTSQSGTLSLADLAKIDPTHNVLAFTLNGLGPFEIQLAIPAPGTLPVMLAAIAADMSAKMPAKAGSAVAAAVVGSTIQVTSGDATQRSSVHFFDASMNSATGILRLGIANGGTEIDSEAKFRPIQSGTVGGPLSFVGLVTPAQMNLNVQRGSPLATLKTITLPLWGAPTTAIAPINIEEAASRVRDALASSTDPLLTGATVSIIDGVLRVLPGTDDPNLVFEFANAGADTSATSLGLTPAGAKNVAHYAPGVGITIRAQTMTLPPGNNGTPPSAVEITGKELLKTGMYALEKVDLFNLLVIPDLLQVKVNEPGDIAAIAEAITYCQRRRAFMIVDTPAWLLKFDDAQKWIGTSSATSLRSRNVALYFPRLRAPDPMMAGSVNTFPAAGALAGLYARTDADRGVWKAPAGITANIQGATGLTVTLTDGENGTLNPLGLNCLRTFKVIGTVSWGARTGRGADALADEYKYVPVRRLALFLEESLYRGTQFAVFEPNDEPLWSQIRLNLGAFMHTLFAQGAFQGQTPRDAYFVKCDKETTTQNDIDLGRVNIVVGFAPLKPAEFVVIQIQQIAGKILV
jgi:phage tail sheath protein FI